ncbi:aftiphilin-like isoform X2 [Limulus polyphemus]|uniref:Aftiphilin-like isoform X2 n=1 Tax=Limulus polyphemus TaxID=6850 RepID=A0ABM1T433_LIMPO|nr:aftiphilin-like isoform X2 [Limulus polyphemus]
MTMSSNLIPILSSSPPPLNEGTFVENDDDEFGDFTAANETNCDASSNNVMSNLTCFQDNHANQPGKPEAHEVGSENNSVSTVGNYNEDEQQFADFSCFSTPEQPKPLNGVIDQNIDPCNQVQSETHHKSDLVSEVNEHHKNQLFSQSDELEKHVDNGCKLLTGVSEFESAMNHDMNSSFEEEPISDVKFVSTICFKTDSISSEKLVLNSDQITSSHSSEALVTLRSEHGERVPSLNSSSDKISTTFHNDQKENNGDSEACKIEQSSSATSSSSVPPLNISDDEDEFFNSDGSTGHSPEIQCCTKPIQESTHVPEEDKSDIQCSLSTSTNSKFISCSAYTWNTQNIISNESCFVGENLHKGITNGQEDVEKDDIPELDLPEVDDFDFGSFTMATANKDIIHDEVGSTPNSYIDHEETKSYSLVLNKNISSKAFEGISDLPDGICALDTGVNEMNIESLQRMEISNLNREEKLCSKSDSVQSFGEKGTECFENSVEIPSTIIINEFPAMKFSNDKYLYDEFQSVQQIMQEESSVGEGNDSESDDFGNFESAKQKLAEPEGFADFENASFSERVEVTSEVLPENSDSNFADFVSSDISSPILNDKNSVIQHGKNNEDFADFESSQSLPCLPTNLLTGMVSSTTKLKEYFTVVFPGKVLEEHVHMKLDQGDHEALFLGDRLSRSHMLWGRLQDIEETPALLYHWGGSRSCQHMLCSLNIDTRNILRNPSIPLFASGLGLLEPTREPVLTDRCHEKLLPAEQPISPEKSSELIPPVQFDWRTSGLINPLESELSSSALLDLDFFSANDAIGENNHTVKTSSLEEEFLGPTPQSPQKLESEPEHQPHLLEKLLSSVKPTTTTVFPSKQATRPPGLSSEAKKVLDKLPDLSFMQAKVLMFPVRSSSVL